MVLLLASPEYLKECMFIGLPYTAVIMFSECTISEEMLRNARAPW